jgi:hypothetical protein
MGRRAKVTMLPQPVRDELNRRLIENAFGGYEDLARWLGEQGYLIKRSSLQRYGHQFERKLEAISLASQQARAVVAASPDREGAMGDALVRLVQQEIFSLLVECKGAIEKQDLAKIARAVADLGRTTVRQREWREEIVKRLEAQRAAAGEKVTELTKAGGLSPEAATEIRNILMGIDPLGERAPRAIEKGESTSLT